MQDILPSPASDLAHYVLAGRRRSPRRTERSSTTRGWPRRSSVPSAVLVKRGPMAASFGNWPVVAACSTLRRCEQKSGRKFAALAALRSARRFGPSGPTPLRGAGRRERSPRPPCTTDPVCRAATEPLHEAGAKRMNWIYAIIAIVVVLGGVLGSVRVPDLDRAEAGGPDSGSDRSQSRRPVRPVAVRSPTA